MLVKSIWIILYIGLRKYLQRIAVNKKAAYLLLFISLSGFAGFIFLVEQTMDDFHVTIPFIFLIMSFLLAALIFLGYFRNLQIEGKQKLDILKCPVSRYSSVKQKQKRTAGGLLFALTAQGGK